MTKIQFYKRGIVSISKRKKKKKKKKKKNSMRWMGWKSKLVNVGPEGGVRLFEIIGTQLGAVL